MQRGLRFPWHGRLCLALVVVLGGTVGCASSGSYETAQTRPLVSRYLDALRRGDCRAAFALTRVAVDPGPNMAAFGEATYLPVCQARKLVDYDLSTYHGLRIGTGELVRARLRYEDGEERTTMVVEDGSVLAPVKKITIAPQSGPMLDPRIDGVPVAREQKSGCPVVCRVEIHDVWVFAGPHDLSVAGGRWTEPKTLPVAADATTVSVVPVPTTAALNAATQAVQRWKPECLFGGGCPGSPCSVNGRTTPPKSMTPMSEPRPQNNGVFGPPFSLNLEVTARAGCSNGAVDVDVVVTLPATGEPEVGSVFPL